MAQLITKLKPLSSSFSFSTSSDIYLPLYSRFSCIVTGRFALFHFTFHLLLGFTFLVREIHSTSQIEWTKPMNSLSGVRWFTCFYFCSYLPFLPLPLSLVISYSPLELDTIIAFWHFIFSTHFLSFLPGWLAGWMVGWMNEWDGRGVSG